MSRNPRKKGTDCKSRRIYGLHVVQEYLRESLSDVQEVYLLPSLEGSLVDQTAKSGNIPVHYKSRDFFRTFAQGGNHQGVAASLRSFAYTSLSRIMERDASLLLILDGILDPRNLGALLRTAEAAGVGGVILPKRRAAPISPLVEKIASGATAYLPICQVDNLARALVVIRSAGYWIVGLVPDAQKGLFDLSLPRKVAVLLGGEEKGLRLLTRQNCDYLVKIPMRGKISSLNVSVAGAVVLYEILRRSL
jgi:23S rRNA (guanosine2251-2'-O)-methyltransferase